MDDLGVALFLEIPKYPYVINMSSPVASSRSASTSAFCASDLAADSAATASSAATDSFTWGEWTLVGDGVGGEQRVLKLTWDGRIQKIV